MIVSPFSDPVVESDLHMLSNLGAWIAGGEVGIFYRTKEGTGCKWVVEAVSGEEGERVARRNQRKRRRAMHLDQDIFGPIFDEIGEKLKSE